MKKLFLDANIVADIVLVREPWCKAAFEILNIASFEVIDLCCSSLTLGTVNYLLTREKFSTEIIKKKLKVFRNNCKMSKVDDSVVDSALNSTFTDFEDAMQYYSAINEGCDIIITRNKKDFSQSQIPVMEPQEFLDEFYNEVEL